MSTTDEGTATPKPATVLSLVRPTATAEETPSERKTPKLSPIDILSARILQADAVVHFIRGSFDGEDGIFNKTICANGLWAVNELLGQANDGAPMMGTPWKEDNEVLARVELVASIIGIPDAEVAEAMSDDDGMLDFCRRYGQSLDWVLDGDMTGIIRGWARKKGVEPQF